MITFVGEMIASRRASVDRLRESLAAAEREIGQSTSADVRRVLERALAPRRARLRKLEAELEVLVVANPELPLGKSSRK